MDADLDAVKTNLDAARRAAYRYRMAKRTTETRRDAPSPAPRRERGAYHHGALRDALIAAAEAELEENGVESFSLRAVARRAGVSHAAPAHHFPSADALLTALAAISFTRFDAALRARAERAGADPAERLAAMTLAYVAYASRSPAMFALQFGSTRPDRSDPALATAAEAAYDTLCTEVEAALAARGGAASQERRREAIAAVWATAHGLADLFGNRPAPMFADASPLEREAAFARIARRVADAL